MAESKPPPYDLTDAEITKIIRLAVGAKAKAYCPYSNFRVGAALIYLSHPSHDSAQSLFITGSNVEIASTPVGTCAERCALAPLIASYKRPQMPLIRGVAVSTDAASASSPCGMCRQFMREFCSGEVKVWMVGKAGSEAVGGDDGAEKDVDLEGLMKEKKLLVMTMGELLPMSFGAEDMRKRDAGVVVT